MVRGERIRKTMKFLLTRLLRGATAYQLYHDVVDRISTHTPLARRDCSFALPHSFANDISTHTPLARRDRNVQLVGQLFAISTHTPLARRDHIGA